MKIQLFYCKVLRLIYSNLTCTCLFLKAEVKKQLVRVAVTSSGHLDESAVMRAIEKKVTLRVILISILQYYSFYSYFV